MCVCTAADQTQYSLVMSAKLLTMLLVNTTNPSEIYTACELASRDLLVIIHIALSEIHTHTPEGTFYSCTNSSE